MEVCIEIESSVKRSDKLHNVNRWLYLGSLFLAIILIIGYLPTPSRSVNGHFWEPALDFSSDWIYLLITVIIFVLSSFISNLNSIIRGGTFTINEEALAFNLGKHDYRFFINELDYLELTGDKELYLRSDKVSFNLFIKGGQHNAIKSLNTLLYKLVNKTEVIVRE